MSKENQTVITKNTLMPISLVIVIVGAVVWLTTIYSQAAENSVKISRLERFVRRVDRRLEQIEIKMNIPPDLDDDK